MKTDINLEQFPEEILIDHKIFHFDSKKFGDWIKKGKNEYLVISRHQTETIRADDFEELKLKTKAMRIHTSDAYGSVKFTPPYQYFLHIGEQRESCQSD